MSEIIEKAKAFATKAHEGQKYGNQPYTYHLQQVVNVLERFDHASDKLLAAAWLHDTLEDTSTTEFEIAKEFGPRVAELVIRVTDQPGNTREGRKRATYPIIAANPFAVLLKLADRIANVECALQDGSGYIQMYKKEQPDFEQALRTEGQYEDMWFHLGELLNSVLVLSEKDWNTFVDHIENPPGPTQALIDLMSGDWEAHDYDTPVVRTKQYTLTELLDGITEDNLHGEI